MAILRCKMCNGTLEYDAKSNTAVCMYCGSKSTVFEQDKKLYEQFQNMCAVMLNQEGKKGLEEGFWVESSREELLRDDGEVIEIKYLVKEKVDICTMYVAKKHVIYLFEPEHVEYVNTYKEMVEKIKYPTEDMKKELSTYIPRIVTGCRLKDGRFFLAIEKKEDTYPLKMLGVLLDRHVAWIISRLENLCCLLDYNDMVLNGFTEENLFVDPANHQIYLYGGWWFAGYMNAEAIGASKTVLPLLRKGKDGKNRNNCLTDLESIRKIAVRLLGFDGSKELKEAKLIPEAFREFLCNASKMNARADFAEWDKVLEKTYGERKFIPLIMTEEEIYSKTMNKEDN